MARLVGQLDVLRRRLELVCRDGHDAVAQDRRRLANRPGRHGAATAARRPGTEAGEGGVALNRGNVLDVGPEGVGGELDHRGLDAVAGRPAGDVDVHLARGLDADGRRLGGVVAESRSGRLHVGRQADAQIPTPLAGLGLLRPERLVVQHLQRLLERLERGDVVVGMPLAFV